MADVWLRPWGSDGDQYAATFLTAFPGGESVAGSVLDLAGKLGSIWTIAFPEDGRTKEGVVLEAWIPRDYRRSMEGLAEASLTVREDEAALPAHAEPARVRTADDLVVHVVGKQR
jgi:hypothetical protein